MEKFNKIKHALFELIGMGNLDIVDSIFSENYVVHSGAKSYSGHKFIKQFAKQVRTAIPTIKVVRVELLSMTDQTVSWQRSFSGIHEVAFKGIPASKKKINWYEIVVSRFENDKIIEEWVASDLASQLMLKHKR